MHELRRHPRVESDRKAWCEHQSLTLYLPVGNVSLGGMFLQTSALFRTGETMSVSIDAAGRNDRIVAQVEIVWLGKSGKGPGVGCRLLSFSEGEAAYGRMIDRLLGGGA